MSYFDDNPIRPKSITKQVRKELDEARQVNNKLRAEVTRLTAELAAKDTDSALDKAELSRIRPHRGEPYFHSTIGEWADQCNLNTQNRLRIEKLEAELAARTSERDVALSGVTSLQRHLDGLRKLVLDHENAEASVCPEDVGFVEYIRALEAERDGLAAALEAIAKQGYLSHETSSADAIKVSDGMVGMARASLVGTNPCPSQDQVDRLEAAIEPFRKYIELRYAIFSEHASDSIPTLQVSHTGRFGVSVAEITKADWDRIRYALVLGVGVYEAEDDK